MHGLIAKRYLQFSRGSAYASLMAAALAFFGGTFHFQSLSTGSPSWMLVKPITALGLMLLAGGMGFARPASHGIQVHGWRYWLPLLSLSGAILIGMQTLGEYALNASFGLEQALRINPTSVSASLPSERMSIDAAITLTLIGSGALLLHVERATTRYLTQWLGITALILASITLIGYLYGVIGQFNVLALSAMTIPTALLLFMLSLSLLAAQPTHGLMAIITHENMGGAMARRMLPLAILLPLSIGILRFIGVGASWYSTELGMAIFAMANVMIFSGIVLITARNLNLIDDAHQRANERFNLAVEATPNAMIMVDHHGIVRLINRRTEKLFGYRSSELVGKPINHLIPEPNRRVHNGYFNDYLRNPVERPMGTGRELHGLHKNGTEIPLEVGLNPIHTPDGVYILASLLDISERKRADEIRAHLAAIVHSSEDVIISKNLDGIITSWNHGAEAVFQYAPEEVIGRSIKIIIPPELHTEEAQLLARLRQGEHIAHYETVRVRKDGSRVDMALTVSPVLNDRGIIIGASKIAHDITDRKRAEQQMRESEARFRQLAENIQEVFWIASADRNELLYSSPMFEKIWGISNASLYRTPTLWDQSIHPDDRQRVLHNVTQRQQQGTFAEEYRIVRPDRSIRWIRDHAYPVRNAAGVVERIVGVAIDITEQRKLEEQLRQSQKMEAIGQLAGGIAHDFNNLLSIIHGNAQMALNDLSTDHPSRISIGEITRASSRATDLVRRILTFSRQQAQEMKSQALQPVVEETVQFLRATLSSMIELRTEIEPNLPAVLIDATQVHQVIMNLATNANYAMRGHGLLEIILSSVEVGIELMATNPELKAGRYVCLTISDNGSGMDPATQQKIFEPFFTTKPHGEGTGLGLAMVHGIMKAHGGAIRVYSTPNVGTVFYLYFPATQSAIVEPKLKMQNTPRGQGQTIMYVDDEEALVFLARRMLESLGYRVSGFSLPEMALKTFAEQPLAYDMVVSDLSMPQLSGAELARRLKQIRPNLPIVLTTGYIRPGDEAEAAQIGVNQLILKPNTVQELSQTLHSILVKSESG